MQESFFRKSKKGVDIFPGFVYYIQVASEQGTAEAECRERVKGLGKKLRKENEKVLDKRDWMR